MSSHHAGVAALEVAVQARDSGQGEGSGVRAAPWIPLSRLLDERDRHVLRYYTSTHEGRQDMMSSKELATQLTTDRSFEGIGYVRIMLEGRMVIVAEDETAKELLPVVENFEAQMEPEEATS